jgi:hypothetical protein
MTLRRPAALAAGALLLAGCYSLAEPTLRPGDARDILRELTRRGVEVSSSVTGASACDDPGLVGNALHLEVLDPVGSAPRDIFIYVFRVRSWEGSAVVVDACQAGYEAAHPGTGVTRVDVPVYRAFGADWSSELTDAVRGALEAASTQGD